MRRLGAFICLVSPCVVSAAGSLSRRDGGSAPGSPHGMFTGRTFLIGPGSSVSPSLRGIISLNFQSGILFMRRSPRRMWQRRKHLIKHVRHNYFISRRNPAIFSQSASTAGCAIVNICCCQNVSGSGEFKLTVREMNNYFWLFLCLLYKIRPTDMILKPDL